VTVNVRGGCGVNVIEANAKPGVDARKSEAPMKQFADG
jgi:hypothetical protein